MEYLLVGRRGGAPSGSLPPREGAAEKQRNRSRRCEGAARADRVVRPYGKSVPELGTVGNEVMTCQRKILTGRS
nr:MAG TPA: hypothetical protein [Caudoviricetes sp.]